MDNINEISVLLVKHLRHELSAGEQLTLDEWLAQNRYGNLLLNELKAESDISMALRELVAIDTNPAELKIRERIKLKLVDADGDLSADTVHWMYFLKTAWFKYAAAIIIFFGVGAYLWSIQKEKPASTAGASVKAVESDVLPGSNRAILTLSDGRKVELTPSAETIIENGTTIQNADGKLSYGKANKVVFNTMSTPRGGQYQLTLSDGTRVWLNAASSITYPTAFTSNTREITIIGEAYFEVKKNSSKPFIVKTPNEDIIVLGTSFNVNAYPDEPFMKTSLAEGVVKVAGTILKPGQAFINGKIESTDLERDIAWKNGMFNFYNTDIRSIMRQIEKWYDVEVRYQDDINELMIAKISRQEPLSEFLKLMELTNLVHFKVDGRKIIVTK